jgi:hypothetical protein
MNETPKTGAATANVAAAPGPAKASSPAPPGPAPAGTPAPVSPRRGRRLLLILFVVACAIAVAAAAVTVLLVTQHPRQAHATSPLHATVFDLHPGQCFNSLPNGIAGAHAVRCRRPHDGEIYGDFRVAGRSWPGSAALGAQARQGCQSRLSGYLNPQLNTTGLAESYAYPNEGSWAAGVHSVICEIRGTQGKLTGSVRASHA